jgi:hypothetical protein
MKDSKVIARAEAKALGLKRYFTGEPCKRGHVVERFVSGAKCSECSRLSDERINQEHRRRKLMSGAAIIRAEAKALGLKYYFTGEPCKNGHVAERMVGNTICME